MNTKNSSTAENNIIEAYDSYKKNRPKYCTYGNIAHMYRLFDKYISIIKILEKYSYNSLSNKKILDIGCGNGSLLRFFADCGCDYDNMYGVDLRQDIIKEGKTINPFLNITADNAENLSFSKNHFDIICLQTVFSSIDNAEMRSSILEKIDDVLKPKGVIIWYDFRYNNPRNKHVVGVSKKDIKRLFNSYEIHLKKLTTLPFIQRKTPQILWPIIRIISDFLPFIKTHYLGLLIKK